MTGSTTLTASVSTINATVLPQSALIDNNTVYTFSITLNDPLSSSGWIEINFPSSIKLPSTLTFLSVTGKFMKASPTINVDTTLNKITLTSLNSSSSVIPAQTF
jgi:hypothetical protein